MSQKCWYNRISLLNYYGGKQQEITMKAISCLSPLTGQATHQLFDIETARPTLNARDVLVKIAAVSINPVDTKVKNGAIATHSRGILGWDAVGEIVEVGSAVDKFSPGDRVWYAGDLTREGSNAEFQAVDERIISLAPKSLSNEEAAALPLTALTAWEMLFDRFGLTQQSSGSILIIGGGGGVGSIAIQLLKARTHMTVIATASREETQTWVTSLGADHVINHRLPLAEQLTQLGLAQPNYVFSTNATETYLQQIAELIAPQGKFGLIDDPESLDILPLKRKSISTHWELMFTRAMFETEDMAQQAEILSQLATLVEEGKVQTTLDTVLGHISAENLTQAHQLIESGRAKGKIVLSGFDE